MECICETCRRKNCPDRRTQGESQIVVSCNFYLKQTNADRIRRFDDDQLAKLLYRMAHKSQKPYNQNQVLEWLKKPAEGSELNG